MTLQSKYAYLAGLTDMAGCFTASASALELRLSVSKPISKFLVERFGGSKGEDFWVWRHDWKTPSPKTESLLLGLLPYLIEKRADANEALQVVRRS